MCTEFFDLVDFGSVAFWIESVIYALTHSTHMHSVLHSHALHSHTLHSHTLRAYDRGVIVVSIVSAEGEVCIAYTSVLVNSWDPRHILGYKSALQSADILSSIFQGYSVFGGKRRNFCISAKVTDCARAARQSSRILTFENFYLDLWWRVRAQRWWRVSELVPGTMVTSSRTQQSSDPDFKLRTCMCANASRTPTPNIHLYILNLKL